MKVYTGKVGFTTNNYEGAPKYSMNDFSKASSDIEVNNFIFEETFNFVSFLKGRSSVTAKFVTPDNNLRATMFVSDLSELLLTGNGLLNLKGYWSFVKKGASIGLVYLGEEKPNTSLEIKNIKEILS